MLEFLSPKKKQVWKAKWIDGEDETKNGFFKFSKERQETQKKQQNGNISVRTGDAVWKTTSSLPIKTDDICWYNGQKYFVVDVAEDETDNATSHLFFQDTGGVPKFITVQRAG